MKWVPVKLTKALAKIVWYTICEDKTHIVVTCQTYRTAKTFFPYLWGWGLNINGMEEEWKWDLALLQFILHLHHFQTFRIAVGKERGKHRNKSTRICQFILHFQQIVFASVFKISIMIIYKAQHSIVVCSSSR